MLKYDSDSESQRPNRKTLFHYLPNYCSQSLYRAFYTDTCEMMDFILEKFKFCHTSNQTIFCLHFYDRQNKFYFRATSFSSA